MPTTTLTPTTPEVAEFMRSLLAGETLVSPEGRARIAHDLRGVLHALDPVEAKAQRAALAALDRAQRLNAAATAEVDAAERLIERLAALLGAPVAA